MKRLIVLVLLVHSFVSYAQIRVACIGNSITYGSGIQGRDSLSYPAQMGKMLGKNYVVRNFGVSGATLLQNGDKPYFKQPAYNSALDFQPNIVVIKLGTNDSKPQNLRFKADFERDYEWLVSSFQTLPSEPEVIVCLPVPAYAKNWDINDSVIVHVIIPAIKSVAERKKLRVINLYEPLLNHENVFPDKIHPNAEGAGMIAKVIAPEILKLGKAPKIPLYKDASQKVDSRVKDLLKRMTLEEKIGQMSQISSSELNDSKPGDSKSRRFRPFLDPEKAKKLIKEYHIGSFLVGFAVEPQQWYKFTDELQSIAINHSRLGIPMIYGNDNIHGANYVIGSTIFPQALGLGCTFNTALAAKMGAITAAEISDLGQPWNFAPVLDVARNPYWPRLYESMGESTHLISEMGSAYIAAMQNSKDASPYKIAATAKHFIGYGDSKSGWDRSPAVISNQELYEYFVPPFREAIKAGVKTFMINSAEVNGVPVHASERLINGLLRKELGFEGVVVTDWADILQLIGQHKMARNEREATKMALLAGIDMSMIATQTTFCDVVKDLVLSKEVPMSVIDKSVSRILKLKFEMGLFENPYPRNDRFKRIGSVENKAAALQAATESIVLLQNDGLLPLTEPKNILVVGPTAHSKRNICGAWTLEWGGAPESMFPENMETVFTALLKKYPTAKIDTISNPILSKGLFEERAKSADVIVVAVGEEPHAEGRGNIEDLTLESAQMKMIKAVKATGKKHIITIFSGRPRVISAISNKANAILWAGLPGYEGATALANILSGEANPSGKLCFTYPRAAGHITPYNVKMHETYTYAWPFGHGLSYSKFEYSNLALTDTIIKQGQTIKASVTITNNSSRIGNESALWFLSDVVRSITPGRQELVHFEKITLNQGESKVVTFEIEPNKQLAFPDENGKMLLEEGEFVLRIGNNKRSFYFVKGGKVTDGKQKEGRSHLQEDI
jgi:beta-glucosidase